MPGDRPVTGDDVGVPVVDPEGWDQVGVVDRVEGETVYVDPDPDVADDARTSLGWEDLGAPHPVPMAAFEREDDDGTTLLLDLAAV